MVKGEENIEEQILVSAFKIFVEKGYKRSKMQEMVLCHTPRSVESFTMMRKKFKK